METGYCTTHLLGARRPDGIASRIDVGGQDLVGSWVLESGNVVAQGLAVSLDKPLDWAVGFFFGNVELSLELWTVIAGISGFDD